ncbi:MAG: hypothetical protein JXX14_08745, partial [Deltaproteobacteria bacterium]|nr:hypothetical protein [Deltaproteobacteria bacterium]
CMTIAVIGPFIMEQLRHGIHPQLATEEAGDLDQSDRLHMARTAEVPPMMGLQRNEDGQAGIRKQLAVQQGEDLLKSDLKPMAKQSGILAFSPHSAYGLDVQAPDNRFAKYMLAAPDDAQAAEVVQTGPGIPKWTGHSSFLEWRGPVSRTQRFRLLMLNPQQNLVLTALRVLLLTLLGIMAIRRGMCLTKQPPSGQPPLSGRNGAPVKKGTAAATTLALCFLFSSHGHAQIPSPEMLNALKDKITPVSQCDGRCTSTEQLEIRITPNQAVLRATVHAPEPGAWSLPGPVTNFVPAKITVDGKTPILKSDPTGYVSLLLTPGIHTVLIIGKFISPDAPMIEFEVPPHNVTVHAPGFTTDGIDEFGNVATQLYMVPERKSFPKVLKGDIQQNDQSVATARNAGDEKNNPIPPWLHITRNIHFDVNWLMTTTVTRVSPDTDPLQAGIPLLRGEHVTGDAVKVRNHTAIVSMQRGQKEIQWTSELSQSSTVLLTAPQKSFWRESWVIDCGKIWQCFFEGAIPFKNSIGQREFWPWPSDWVRVSLHRPKAVPGRHTTIDDLAIQITPGKRITKGHAVLNARASQRSVQKITLPKEATIHTLQINGRVHPYRQQGRTLEIPLSPGRQQVSFEWQQPLPLTFDFKVPRLGLDKPANNIAVSVTLPEERWIILTNGPQVGPVVLFWGGLVAVILLAIIVPSRFRLNPLKPWQWALLALGLYLVSVQSAVLVALWFFAVAWRCHAPMKDTHPLLFNLAQMGLLIWTLAVVFVFAQVVTDGLAAAPDMHITGNHSSSTRLSWYSDHCDSQTPAIAIISAASVIWKFAMLPWSIWLAFNMVKWAKWTLAALRSGSVWKSMKRRRPTPDKPPQPASPR